MDEKTVKRLAELSGRSPEDVRRWLAMKKSWELAAIRLSPKLKFKEQGNG